MSGDGADRVTQGYRAASEALDERPSAATRAAILAAAARQVQAGPRDAQSPLATSPTPSRSRWPLAAVATVLLSTLAVMMATRTEREMSTFTPPTDAVAEKTAPIAPAAPTVDSTTPATAPAEPPAPSVERKQQRGKGAAAARLDAPSAAPSTANEARRNAAAAPAIAPKVAAPAAEPLRAKEELEQQRTTEPRVSDQGAPASSAASPPTMSTDRDGLLKRAPAPAAMPDSAVSAESPARQRDERSAVSGAAQQAAKPAASESAGAAVGQARSEVDLGAEAWLEKIIALRAGGRDAEADAELKRFRERYPQVQVPPSALPPTGTR